MKNSTTIAALLGAVLAAPAMAESSYQNTCSNTGFVFSGADAALTGTCLRRDGSPNKTTLIIKGVSNKDGILTQGEGASSFQKSCGSIQIKRGVLSANCRMRNAMFRASSLVLPDIANINGELKYD